MKALIRRGCFETNSSSAHSVSIAECDKDFVLDTIYPDENGNIEIPLQEFGWGWFKHNDAITKAAYAWQRYEHSTVMRVLIIEVIKEHTGANNVSFVGEGCIDHQSHGKLGLKEEKEDVMNFIFNKNSWLFGGNDNEYADPSFYDVPIFRITDNKITEKRVKLTHCVVFKELDGVRGITFTHLPTEKELKDAFYWAMSNIDSYLILKSNYFVDNDNRHSIMDRIHGFGEVPKDSYEYYSFDYNSSSKYGRVIFIKKNIEWRDHEKAENQKSYNFEVKQIEPKLRQD